jgi:ArsR family transcriptional regulator, arsenate/arsenite/antimonite-responsive transcriptional repressor
VKDVENYFKGLADGNRLRIVNLLLSGELCGCDIQYVLQSGQSNISRHLTYLKRCGLVEDRREGYRVYYRLAEHDGPEYTALVAYLKSALTDKVFSEDRKNLARAIKQGACSVSELRPALVSLTAGTSRAPARR